MGSGKTREFNGLIDCVAKTARRSGVLSLYQGFGVSVQGIIVYRGAYFGLYDTATAAIFGDKVKEANVIFKWMVAQVVTSAAGILSYPFDTVRRRLMMQVCPNSLLFSIVGPAFLRDALGSFGVASCVKHVSLATMQKRQVCSSSEWSLRSSPL